MMGFSYLFQAIGMDVFFLKGNSGEKTVSKRIAGGIERDTSFRYVAEFPAQAVTHSHIRTVASRSPTSPVQIFCNPP